MVEVVGHDLLVSVTAERKRPVSRGGEGVRAGGGFWPHLAGQGSGLHSWSLGFGFTFSG